MTAHDSEHGLSRFTDPGGRAAMLAALPDDPLEICAIAGRQTVHHNLLPFFGVPSEEWPAMRRVRPPRFEEILRALEETEPGVLTESRPVERRVLGGCLLESHFLAGLLRHKGLRARIRAGYFKNIRSNRDHIVRFWEHVLREKRVQPDLLDADPQAWRERVNAYTARKNELDHRIEHWVCEHWDDGAQEWVVLDANDTFLRAHSGLSVGFALPREHFEYAHEAWREIRSGEVDPDRYAEEPQDGRSHVRSQLLWDYLSLLNHDVAGFDEPDGPAYAFVKGRSYEESSAPELEALDALAALLSRNPSTPELADFYWATPSLRVGAAEHDPYSFVSEA